MKKIKYLVNVEEDGETYIRVEDGGVASIYDNTEHLITEYYQDRCTKKEIDWEALSEGKKYLKDWEETDLSKINEEMIQDALNWLFMATEPIEFVKVDTIEELFNI